MSIRGIAKLLLAAAAVWMCAAIDVVAGEAPAAPTLVSPTGTGISTTPTYTFTTSAGAASYQIFLWSYATNAGGITTVGTLGTNGANRTLTQVDQLAFGDYAWAVQAVNASGVSAWSSVVTFTVGTPPGIPASVSPSSTGIVAQPIYTFLPSTEATSYQITLWSSVTNVYGLYATVGPLGTNGANLTLTQATPLGPGYYAWGVRALNAYGNSAWSPYKGFAVAAIPPSAPVQISPSGGGIVAQPTYTFVPSAGATSYQIFLWGYATNAGGLATVGTLGTNGANRTLTQATPLAPGDYAWAVQAVNASGDSAWSTAIHFTVDAPAEVPTTINLAWDPSPDDAQVAGHTVYWGTNSGKYVFTNVVAGTQTNATISSVLSAGVYYFALKAYDSNGLLSDFSNEAIFTNGLTGTYSALSLPPGATNLVSKTTKPAQATNNPLILPPMPTGIVSTTTNPAPATRNPEFYWTTNHVEMPPTLVYTNQQFIILGTIGATVQIESSTNWKTPNSLSWTPVTNITLTNLLVNTPTNLIRHFINQASHLTKTTLTNLLVKTPSVRTPLDDAFVPALQVCVLPQSDLGSSRLFRVAMPDYDYPILADMVLHSRGVDTRLIAVRMPGIDGLNVCYVTPEKSFIDYDGYKNVVMLKPSGSTIPQVANTLANSLGQNWISATEFVYSNGVCKELATVVKTEGPARDPVAGRATSSIHINF